MTGLPIIEAKELRKTYRLYSNPRYRLMDIFGLLRSNNGAFTEHVALNGINLTINRGEKVAIIGRNGAGKSTFLKIVTKVVRPTSGSMTVRGEVSALLQIGAGFHPDFTGRENVYAYLAQLGITGDEADKRAAEITEFAELEEYIGQPVKTYSTGMGARLMFAASTAIKPEILVLDEILGVGDAYFAQKSYERMKEMCDVEGTTLLLVTHDIYSASNMCDRMIWIDRGAIAMDGPSGDVVHAYEYSIKEQEEKRLRRKRLETLKVNTESAIKVGGATPQNTYNGQIHRAGRLPAEKGIFISHIRFNSRGSEVARYHACDETEGYSLKIISDPSEGNWGKPKNIRGRVARDFLCYGSIYNRLPFLLSMSKSAETASEDALEVEVGILCENNADFELALYGASGAKIRSAHISYSTPGVWADIKSTLADSTDDGIQAPPKQDGVVHYGQKRLEITALKFVDEFDSERHQFELGSRMKVLLNYRINDPAFDEKPMFILGFQKNGLIRSHRFWSDQIRLSASDSQEGVIEIDADPLLIAPGEYLVTLIVFQEGYYSDPSAQKFFTMNDKVHDCHSRAYKIVVLGSKKHPVLDGVIFQHPTSWIVGHDKKIESGVCKG